MTLAGFVNRLNQPGKLHGGDLPWPIPVVVVDVRRQWNQVHYRIVDKFAWDELQKDEARADQADVYLHSVWVDANRVKFDADDSAAQTT